MSDLISRADAIEAVRGLSVLVDEDEDFSYFEEALKALPSVDAVSREWYDDAVKANHELAFTDLPDIPRYYYEKVVGKMAHEINVLKEQLESAEAVQGEWILVKGSNGKDYHKCSKCLHTQEITGVKNYCAVCGARMKGGDNE